MQYRFHNFVGGKLSGTSLPSLSIESVDGSLVAQIPDSDLTELVAVRDELANLQGSSPRSRLSNSHRPMNERVDLVRSLFDGFAARRDELIDVVHSIHGTSKTYLRDSFASLEGWVNQLESFVENVNGFSTAESGVPFTDRSVLTPYALVTAGNFEVYESFYVLAQTILSGTRFVVRPSAYDIATHIIFEVIDEKGLTDLGQKITWDSSRQPELIRHLLRFVRGASIFGSDEQIQRILITSVLEKYPDGRIRERVIEDISKGRKVKAYGSGNAMMVVMDNPKVAAKCLYYAAVLARGNKCWVPDGAVILRQHVDAFYDELVRLDGENADNRPRFRPQEIRAISKCIEDSVGRLDHGTYTRQDNSLGIMICRDLASTSPFFDHEITFPATGLVPVDNLQEAAATLRHILDGREADAYLSVGYFGAEKGFESVKEQVPSETYRLNEPLVVDLMKPHQGSYFMLDPTIGTGGLV